MIDAGGIYGDCLTATVNRACRVVTVRANAVPVAAGSRYTSDNHGSIGAGAAPSRSVNAPLSVDGGGLAWIAVDSSGSVYVTRREEFAAESKAYGSLTYTY